MTRRRALGCLALAMVFASSLAAGWVYLSDSRTITRQQLERVEKGMTRDQIVSIVGGPPGDYRSDYCIQMPHGIRYSFYDHWLCDEGELLVCFDDQGTAIDVKIYE